MLSGFPFPTVDFGRLEEEPSGMAVENEVGRGHENINCFPPPPFKRFMVTFLLFKEFVSQGCESCVVRDGCVVRGFVSI